MSGVTPRVPIVFPPNPTVGDIFTAQNGAQYRWDGTAWEGVSIPCLPITGGTLTGPLQTLGGLTTNLPLRISNATTGFWSNNIDLFVRAGGSPIVSFQSGGGGQTQFAAPVILQADPTHVLGATTKQYVDNKFVLAGTSPGAFQVGPILIQWGQATSPTIPPDGAIATTVTFPRAFSANGFACALTAQWFYTTGPEMTTLYRGSGISPTDMAVVVQNYQTFDVTVIFDWIVIGPA